MKQNFLLISIAFFCQGFVASQALTLDSLAVMTNQGARIIFKDGDVVICGSCASTGIEVFSGTQNQVITGTEHASGGCSFGQIVKANTGMLQVIRDVSCDTWEFASTGLVMIADSATVTIRSASDTAIFGAGPDRYFVTGNSQGFLARAIPETVSAWYIFPVGTLDRMQRFDVKPEIGDSIGTITATTHEGSPGLVQTDIILTDSACALAQQVWLDCLQDGYWSISGPDSLVYQVRACGTSCGLGYARVVQSPMGSGLWDEYAETVVGNLAENLCAYSDWSGLADTIPGGLYQGLGKDFAIASGMNALPVTWGTVVADGIENKLIRVSWETVMELQTEKFIIERGMDGVVFESIGTVDAAGYSTNVLHYMHDDFQVEPNRDYYYRIRQEDIDGSVSYSLVVSARIIAFPETEIRYSLLGQQVSNDYAGLVIAVSLSRRFLKVVGQ